MASLDYEPWVNQLMAECGGTNRADVTCQLDAIEREANRIGMTIKNRERARSEFLRTDGVIEIVPLGRVSVRRELSRPKSWRLRPSDGWMV